MKNKLDNILLATLWLSASTLVTCFWFNIKFGFNIFNNTHWRHLAYMQANQTPIAPTFYISIIASVVITITGLYMLFRPRLRKITIRTAPHPDTQTKPQTPHVKKVQQTTPSAGIPQKTPEPPSIQPTQQIPEPTLSRPPRLNLGLPLLNQTENFTAPATPITPAQSTTTQPQQTNQYKEIDEIFEDAGYTLKDTPKIKGVQTSLFAIGTNETLWIGAVNINTSDLQTAINTVQQIFLDTLDDIEISIHGFVLHARDASAPASEEILTFDSTDSLRKYMNEHTNTPPSDDEKENFDAFSSYISTVIEYLGKF